MVQVVVKLVVVNRRRSSAYISKYVIYQKKYNTCYICIYIKNTCYNSMLIVLW